MRWGVRDDATNAHMTTELCLREIKACQEISVGPNFVVGIPCYSFPIFGHNIPFPPFPNLGWVGASNCFNLFNFFQQTLLSEKYGYRPLLPSIDAQEFEMLLNFACNEDTKELFDKYERNFCKHNCCCIHGIVRS